MQTSIGFFLVFLMIKDNAVFVLALSIELHKLQIFQSTQIWILALHKCDATKYWLSRLQEQAYLAIQLPSTNASKLTFANLILHGHGPLTITDSCVQMNRSINEHNSYSWDFHSSVELTGEKILTTPTPG